MAAHSGLSCVLLSGRQLWEGRLWDRRGADTMQVYFLGADTNVNYQPSSTWLAEQARDWPWRSHLLMNAPRSEALSVLRMEGMMVVFCSLVENMPYVVAEVPASAHTCFCLMHSAAVMQRVFFLTHLLHVK